VVPEDAQFCLAGAGAEGCWPCADIASAATRVNVTLADFLTHQTYITFVGESREI